MIYQCFKKSWQWQNNNACHCFTSIKQNWQLHVSVPVMPVLTLKAPITTAADDIHKHFFIVFSEKIRLDVSSVSSSS